MKEVIISIIAAVFNIVIIVCNACGAESVGKVLVAVAPEVNIIAVGVLYFFNIRSKGVAK